MRLFSLVYVISVIIAYILYKNGVYTKAEFKLLGFIPLHNTITGLIMLIAWCQVKYGEHDNETIG